jgi:hypothetical protein
MLAGLATIAPPAVGAVHIAAQTEFRMRNARVCTKDLIFSDAPSLVANAPTSVHH